MVFLFAVQYYHKFFLRNKVTNIGYGVSIVFQSYQLPARNREQADPAVENQGQA